MRVLLLLSASSRSLLPVLLSLLLLALAVATAPVSCAFTEELLLQRPAVQGGAAVVAHFHFTNNRHIDTQQGEDIVNSLLFPKSIHQLVQKFAVQELYVSFAQGRWNQRAWGAPPHPAAPAGAQLWARFDPQLTEAQVQEEWRSLTHALSGLLCASLNYLEGAVKTAAPAFAFRPAGIPSASNSSNDHATQFTNTKYGALAREAVCTENLTPWLKLLPCRDHAGLAKLLADRERLFGAQYYSQNVIIQRSGATLVLTQTLTVVLKPVAAEAWSLSSLFGSTLDGACEVASISSVYVHDSMGDAVVPSPVKSLLLGDQGQHYVYTLSRGARLDIAANDKRSISSKSGQSNALFTLDRYLTGRGNERGGMVIEVHAMEDLATDTSSIKCVDIFQMAPWYVRIYLHTLRVLVDGATVPDSALRALRLQPAKDRDKPSVIEISLCLASNTKMVAVVMDFDKAFLRNDEHPPDPNRGFDLPAAVITVHAATNPAHGNEPLGTPLLRMLQSPPNLQLFTNSLTFPVATPDFSMQYNVATLSCTVLAILFGSLLNAFIYRPVKVAKAGNKAGLIARLKAMLKSGIVGK